MELDNQLLYWPIFSNVFKEISLSFFNGYVSLPIWAWIPQQTSVFPSAKLPATQAHLKAIFDAEFARFYEHESYFPLKFRPREKVIYHQQTDVLCISVFFYLKIPQIQCYFLIYNNLEDGIRENIDLFQIAENMGKNTEQPRAIDLPNILFRIYDYEILFCVSAVINIQNAFSNALQNIYRVTQTWLRTIAKWLFLTVFLDNSEKIRRIMDSKIQQLVNYCVQCQYVVYELNVYSDTVGREILSALRNCDQFTSKIISKKYVFHNNTFAELFPDLIQQDEAVSPNISDIGERSDGISSSSSLCNACDDDFRETFIYDKMYVYKLADKLYHTPLVIWDCLDQCTQIYNIRDALIQNLKTVACYCYYLKRIANEVDGALHIEYLPTLYTPDEVDFAVDNTFALDYLQQILAAFMFSCFHMTIIGPPPLANLLARSLSALAPPGVRSYVIYAPLCPEYVLRCNSTVNDMQRFLDLPITSSQRTRASSLTHYYNNREINLNSPVAQNSIYNSGVFVASGGNAEPNIYYQYEACSCGIYQHGPQLVNGVKIYCVSCGTYFFHYLDYLQCSGGSPIIAYLGNGQILNFGPIRQFSRRAEELLMCVYRGNMGKLRAKLLQYCAKFHLDYCIPLGHKHVFRRLSSHFEYAYCHSMYVVSYLVSEMLQSERQVYDVQFWRTYKSLLKVLERIPPQQINDYLARAIIPVCGYYAVPVADNVLYGLFQALHRKYAVFRVFSALGHPVSTDVVYQADAVDIHVLSEASKRQLKNFYNRMVNSEQFSSDGEEAIVQCIIQYFSNGFGDVVDV